MFRRATKGATELRKKLTGRLGGRLNDIPRDEFLRATPNIFGHDRRRIWMTDDRAHLELRDVGAEGLAALAAELEDEVANIPGVELHDVNAVTGRVIFAFDAPLGWKYFEGLIERIEERLGMQEVPFPTHRPKYPPDVEPILRELLEMSLDSASVSIGLVLKAVGHEPSRLALDLANFTALAENTPRLRRWLEQQLGSAPVNVGLGSVTAVAQALAAGPVGPALDLALRVIRVKGELSRRELWEQREPELCGPRYAFDFGCADCPERPRELPGGDIEHYAEDALFASLGGFAVGLLDTEKLEPSFAPLLGGLPKAARYGREGFIAQLTSRLADRDILAMRPNVLERMDRVNAVVIEGRALRKNGKDPRVAAENLAAAARAARMKIVVVSDDEKLATSISADEWVRVTSERWREKTLQETVRQLQKEGRVVCYVGVTPSRAFLAADIGLGVHRGQRPPWQADLIAPDDLDAARFVVEACRCARELANESVVLAGAGALVGSLALLGRGLEDKSPSNVMLAVNFASLVALANGVRRANALAESAPPPIPDETPWHSMSASQVLKLVGSSKSGLAREEAEARQTLPDEPHSWVRDLAGAVGAELLNPFTPILTGGAALSAAVGSPADAAMVGAAIALNAVVSGGERFQAERAVAQLEQLQRDPVTVLRDDEPTKIQPEELVLGDVLLLENGDIVPADCRILKARGLEVDEASLTGESLPVTKSARKSNASEPAEQSSMLFAGTSLTAGEATGVVVALGDATQVARSARLAQTRDGAEGVEARLRDLAAMTLPVAGYSGGLLATIGLLREQKMEELVSTGVGLAVAAVPEGLPLLATIAQLGAARRLAGRGIIVRNPRTIEALGRVDVLCADKTGTLTEGRLELHGVANRNGVLVVDELIEEEWSRAVLAWAKRASPHRNGSRLPHATDEAVVMGARDHGLEADESWRRLAELAFDSSRGFHAVLGEVGGTTTLCVKGAPEVILPLCTQMDDHGRRKPMTSAQRKRILESAEEFAADGLRVLGVALRDARTADEVAEDDLEDLTFVGFVLLSDPIRPSSAQAVRRLHGVGIDTIMITGDHPKTAIRIAKEASIIDEADAARRSIYLTGPQIERMTDSELDAALADCRVVARATPLHKVRIVASLQRLGRCVAMTGDGGNDASAIQMADVGIALGAESTKAARHAADMVVIDEHLETIVAGIAEGRAMWPALRDAVSILLGGNLGEIGFTVASGLLDKHAALNARQLLLINLLTDIAPAMAIALKAPSDETLRDILGEEPEAALGERLDHDIAVRALATAGGGSMAFLASRWLPSGEKCASTVALLAIVGSQLGQTLATGTHEKPTILASLGSAAVMLGIVETPGLSQAFGCRPIGPIGLSIAAGSSVVATVGAKYAPTALSQATERIREKLIELVGEDEPHPEKRPLPSSEPSRKWPFAVIG